MKEVHKYKQTPTDIIELDPSLKKEFCRVRLISVLYLWAIESSVKIELNENWCHKIFIAYYMP